MAKWVPGLCPLPAQQQLWPMALSTAVPAVPGGINSHCRACLGTTVAPRTQWQSSAAAPVTQAFLQEPSAHQWQPLKGPAWHINPFYTEYPHTETILPLQTILQLTLHWSNRSLKFCYPDFLETRSRVDLESQEQILSCQTYNITDCVVDRTVKEPLLLQKSISFGLRSSLVFPCQFSAALVTFSLLRWR